MKKLLRKFKKQMPPDTGGRITNETVAEHRERVLAGGRKFKYPLQYTKHRVLIVTVSIVVITTLSFFGFCGWQLYSVQSTDKFIYSLTQFVPVPVAKIDGTWVRYSDYLLELRSAIHYLNTKEAVNFNSDDGKRQLDYQKRLALDKAVQNTLVEKLASEQRINVSQKEVDDFVKAQISTNRLGVNENVYKQVIRDYYDWTFDEYKNSIREQLLRKKVQAQLDTESRKKITDILQRIEQGGDFAAIVKESSEDVATKGQGGDMGTVNKDTEDPNGIIAAASNFENGQISGVIEGVDGFYIVKMIEKAPGGDMRLAKMYVGYKLLDQKMAEFKKQGAIQEFITVKQISQPTSQ